MTDTGTPATPQPASPAQLLESLDRHFLAGCLSLSTTQLRQHKVTGTCHECARRAALAAELRAVVAGRGAADGGDQA